MVPRKVIIPEEANYTAEVVWYVWDNEDAFVEYEGDTFQNGKIYCLEVSAYPNEGYEFDEAKTTLVMDGEPTVHCWNTCLMAEICYTFGAENQVEKIELTGLQLPKDGNLVNLDSIQVAEGTNCTLIGAVWMESETGDINSEEWELAEKFQAGKYYALVIMTSPADGYMFGEDIPILIDGQEVQPDVRESTAYSDLSVLVFEVSEETPEQKPEDTPEDKPENMPEQKPEDQPEQKHEKDPEAVTPATSDAFMDMPLIGLMVLSALGVLVVAAWKKYNFA